MSGKGRELAAVVAGFLAMSGFALIAFMAAFMLVGKDMAFLHHGTNASSPLWTGFSVVLGFLAALVGGGVCGCIAMRSTSTWILASFVALFGFAYATISLVMEVSPTALNDADSLTSQFLMRSPTWLLFANPLIDVVGILLGGRLAMRGRAHEGTSPPKGPAISSCAG